MKMFSRAKNNLSLNMDRSYYLVYSSSRAEEANASARLERNDLGYDHQSEHLQEGDYEPGSLKESIDTISGSDDSVSIDSHVEKPTSTSYGCITEFLSLKPARHLFVNAKRRRGGVVRVS